jgi:hypothetical protein
MNPITPFTVRPIAVAAPLGRADPLRIEAPHRSPAALVTLAIIEDRSWSATAIAMQLLRWRYDVLCFKPADLLLCDS